MTIQETQQQILDSDEFVLSEIKKIQMLHSLKREIRWNQVRADGGMTESVADHIYGMQIIANYFLPLEDPEHTLNWERISALILWHDVDEIVTGDIITSEKTTTDVANAKVAVQQVIANSPTHMQAVISDLLQEYEEKATPEAAFVKAIDRIEAIFEVYRPGYEKILREIDRKSPDWDTIVKPYMQPYPYLKRFADIIHARAIAEGYFSDT